MKIHIVQKGDTLWKIAKKYGANFEELKKMNSQLSNPDMIMPGMKVKVPTIGGNIKKEAPIMQTKPGAPINMGVKKEMPIVEHPFAKEKPKEMPIAEVPPQPIVKEAPKVPYTPKMPQPVIPEIDINNYYMLNMANMSVQQPQPTLPPKPEVILPIVKEAPKKEEAPKEMPIQGGVEQPMYPQECIPISPIMPGPGFNYPWGYPQQPMPYAPMYPGINPAMNPGMYPGMNPMNPGMNPVNPGMYPGMNPGMTGGSPGMMPANPSMMHGGGMPYHGDESSSFMPQMPQMPQMPMMGQQGYPYPRLEKTQKEAPIAQQPFQPSYVPPPPPAPVQQPLPTPPVAEMPIAYQPMPIVDNCYPVSPVMPGSGFAPQMGYPYGQMPYPYQPMGPAQQMQGPMGQMESSDMMMPMQGYPQQAPGMQNPMMGYPQQAPGMQNPMMGYPQQAQGMQSPMMGYPQQAPGMQNPMMGYPQQGPSMQNPMMRNKEEQQQSFVPSTPPVYSAPYPAQMIPAQPPLMNPYGMGPYDLSRDQREGSEYDD